VKLKPLSCICKASSTFGVLTWLRIVLTCRGTLRGACVDTQKKKRRSQIRKAQKHRNEQGPERVLRGPDQSPRARLRTGAPPVDPVQSGCSRAAAAAAASWWCVQVQVKQRSGTWWDAAWRRQRHAHPAGGDRDTPTPLEETQDTPTPLEETETRPLHWRRQRHAHSTGGDRDTPTALEETETRPLHWRRQARCR